MGGGPFRLECFVHGRSGLSSSDTLLFFSCSRAATSVPQLQARSVDMQAVFVR